MLDHHIYRILRKTSNHKTDYLSGKKLVILKQALTLLEYDFSFSYSILVGLKRLRLCWKQITDPQH